MFKQSDIFSASSILKRADRKCLLRAAGHADAAAHADGTVDLPFLVRTVHCDSADRALLRAQGAVNAAVAEDDAFLADILELEDVLRALGNTNAALDALGMIHGPGPRLAVHSDRLLRAVAHAEAAVETVVLIADQLAEHLLLEGHAGRAECARIAGHHMIILGQLDRITSAEILAETAEGAGGQIKGSGNVDAAFDFLFLSADCHRSADLDAHAAVHTGLRIKLNAAAVSGRALVFRTWKLHGKRLFRQILDGCL